MSTPSKMILTPNAAKTVAAGESTDASSEFWQIVAGSTAIVYEGVPYALAQEILTNNIPDTAIALQLAAYPKRIVSNV